MPAMTIEMLTPERVTELWPVLEPYFDDACKGNEIAKDELDANGACWSWSDAVQSGVLAHNFGMAQGQRGAVPRCVCTRASCKNLHEPLRVQQIMFIRPHDVIGDRK
jgi:hypothetical protein